jgi:hypothetical protein
MTFTGDEARETIAIIRKMVGKTWRAVAAPTLNEEILVNQRVLKAGSEKNNYKEPRRRK